MAGAQYDAGMRWTDIEDVREVLTGWTLEWSGRGSQRLLSVKGADAEWIIQRREGDEFRAFRLRREVSGAWPEGRPVFDTDNQLNILSSARQAAELIAFLYRPERRGLFEGAEGLVISPDDIERLLALGRMRRGRRPARIRLGRRR